VIWSREDDMRGGYYRPLHVHRVQVGLDGQSMPLVWHHSVVGQSIAKGTLFEKMMIKNASTSFRSKGSSTRLITCRTSGSKHSTLR